MAGSESGGLESGPLALPRRQNLTRVMAIIDDPRVEGILRPVMCCADTAVLLSASSGNFAGLP
jgi:hypothetical protein